MGVKQSYLICFLLLILSFGYAWHHKDADHGLTISTNIRNEVKAAGEYSKRIFLTYHGNIQDEFTLDKTYKSCQNIPKFEDDLYAISRKFYFSHHGESDENHDLKLYATIKPYGVHGGRIPIPVFPDTITLDDKTPVKVKYDCSQIPKEYTHAVVELEVSNGKAFQYLKQCHQMPKMFWIHFMQFLALAFLAMTILIVGSKMGKLSLFERIDEFRFDYYKISIKTVLMLIILSSVVLVMSYYLLPFKWFNTTVTALLCICALVMLLFLFMDFIDWMFCIEEINEFEGSGHFMDQPCLGGGFNLKATISLFLSVVIVLLWFLLRHWILSNLLAICVACTIVKVFRFNALYPAFLILLGFLVFDVFWVFASPVLFNGHSVIHEVLREIDFPLKLGIPGSSPFISCANLSIVDIVVPTFYISFISRFGRGQSTNSYYLAHVIMYAISLGLFTLMMVYTGSEQPALMYIIPCLFITTFITAGIRKEWGTQLSMSSTLEGEGPMFVSRGSDKAIEEASARGMDRFDHKLFSNAGGVAQQFQKFEDDPADDERVNENFQNHEEVKVKEENKE
ncbi:unnamed protein product [Moneuplotes crassus]|uniref:Uncharacterized protein n=1 Tax=Euplotes crassus TaxID=5936 RepID=A0AAD1UFM3_EUPCR|nr:unnamed protein product [Moneuplotes crassus]